MGHDAAYWRDYYQKNREKLIARSRAWWLAHPEQHAANQRAYYATHREEQHAYDLARRPAKVAAAQKRKDGLVADLKTAPCMDCGQTFPPECMDFDHVRGEKVKNVGMMFTGSLKLLLAEIAKCDLVCSNCHRIRTRKRRMA